MMACRIVRLLAGVAVAVASPATATVSLVKIGAYSTTDETIGTTRTFKPGSDQESTRFADPFVASTSDQRDEYHFAQIRTSAAGAVRLNSLNDIDFIVRASVDADSLADQVGTHGTATGAAVFTFSLDTDSRLSFSIGTVPVSASNASFVTASLFSLDAAGLAQTYYREGVAAGRIAPTYDLPAGTYSFVLSAFADGGTPAYSRFNGLADISTIAVANLSINSPPLIPGGGSAVPEPATWVMTMSGFGALGVVVRARRRKPALV